MISHSFLPTTPDELKARGWSQLDIILITGDTYIDAPNIGCAVIGRVLEHAGYQVGIIAQPDLTSPESIQRLGEPRLFWGVTAGCMDSMVANYTPSLKKRHQDDLTPGGENILRPNRATIAYCNAIQHYFKHTVPIVIGGVEASMRRIAHYDYWQNKIRRSLLFDAKADYLLYGMAETSILQLAGCLKAHENPNHIPGLCYISKEKPSMNIEVPDYHSAASDKHVFCTMFKQFYEYMLKPNHIPLIQKTNDRYLIHNPPPPPISPESLDEIYDLPYQRDIHPYYKTNGAVKALDTIRFSITTHRGCYGGCNFCSIALHQGSFIISRNMESITQEAEKMTQHPAFKGVISNIGGPSANMYGSDCGKKKSVSQCVKKQCLFPNPCSSLQPSHKPSIELLRRLRSIKGIKHIFIGSGVRFDLVLADKKEGEQYLKELIRYHISGQLKIAPEHTEDEVVQLMGKPSTSMLIPFRTLFYKLARENKKNVHLSYYFIAAHPGCTKKHCQHAKQWIQKNLKLTPEQVQIFTPLPSTWSALQYYTEINPSTKEALFVEKNIHNKQTQKDILTQKYRTPPTNKTINKMQSKKASRKKI